MQLTLVEDSSIAPAERIELEDGEVTLVRGFFSASDGWELFADLRESVTWKQDEIKMFGKVHLVPRLHQWYGDPGTVYRWSGIEMRPEPWTARLEAVRRRVEARAGSRFNSLLLNLYRNGDDTVGWHADDEPTLGRRPVIASLSLGATRDFVLRPVGGDGRQKKRTLALEHGSLLLMSGDTQSNWQHCVPRRKRVKDARINLTFRSTALHG